MRSQIAIAAVVFGVFAKPGLAGIAINGALPIDPYSQFRFDRLGAHFRPTTAARRTIGGIETARQYGINVVLPDALLSREVPFGSPLVNKFPSARLLDHIATKPMPESLTVTETDWVFCQSEQTR